MANRKIPSASQPFVKSGGFIDEIWHRYLLWLDDRKQMHAFAAPVNGNVINGPGVVFADASSAPLAYVISAGFDGMVIVKKQDGTPNSVTVSHSGGTIDGAASVSWTTQYQSYTFAIVGGVCGIV